MFKAVIEATPFATDAANCYFTNITGDAYKGDVSFLSTLRALIAPRIDDADKIHLTFTQSSYTEQVIHSCTARTIVEAITKDAKLREAYGVFGVHSFGCDKEDNLATMQIVNDHFCEYNDGYRRLEKVTAFYKKSFDVSCFVNPDRKSVVLFVSNLDIRKMHYLQLAIIPTLPWYFDPAVGVSDDEMHLIESLKEGDKYIECLCKLSQQYNFRDAKIRKELLDIETAYARAERDLATAYIAKYDNDIDELNKRIGCLLHQRNEQCIKLLGLNTIIAEQSDESELMNYFLCNKSLILERVENTTICFTVADYLTYFDKEMVETMLTNKDNIIYSASCGCFAPQQIEHLLRSIFIDETLRIRLCAAFQLCLAVSVEPLDAHDFPSEIANTYMPNPHIDSFRCMGNNVTIINQFLKDCNHIGAIEQCIASCKSLNWGDAVVIEKFICWLRGGDSSRNNRCIELPNGEVVDPQQAVKWLETQDEPCSTEDTEEVSS